MNKRENRSVDGDLLSPWNKDAPSSCDALCCKAAQQRNNATAQEVVSVALPTFCRYIVLCLPRNVSSSEARSTDRAERRKARRTENKEDRRDGAVGTVRHGDARRWRRGKKWWEGRLGRETESAKDAEKVFSFPLHLLLPIAPCLQPLRCSPRSVPSHCALGLVGRVSCVGREDFLQMRGMLLQHCCNA